MRGDTFDLFPDDLPEETRTIDNSPASIAQRERFLRALRLGTVNTFDARDRLGILMPAARIFELRALGYEIDVDYRRAVDRDGVEHDRIAHYSLLSSPDPETPPQSVASLTGPGERGNNDDE